MTPENIENSERDFAEKLKVSSATYTKGKVTSIGKYSITEIRPSYSNYYYSDTTAKTAICLHFTVGSIKSDVHTLTKQANHVSVNYVVDRLGNIYNLFPDDKWSYHLGSSAVGGNSAMSKRTIGIEISNYGPLKKTSEGYIDAYNSVYTKDDSYVEACSYRGYDYYCKYTDSQVAAVKELITFLCQKHGIEKNFRSELFGSASEALAFNGIYTHSAVRSDKFDMPDSMFELFKVTSSGIRVTEEQIDELMSGAQYDVHTVFGKTTIVSARLANGFVITESSSCVDPANYDEELGVKYCKERIRNRLWELEGYALQKSVSNG